MRILTTLLLAALFSCQVAPAGEALSFTVHDCGEHVHHCQISNPTRDLWLIESYGSDPAPFIGEWTGSKWEDDGLNWCRYGVGLLEVHPGESVSFLVQSEHPDIRVSLFAVQVAHEAEFQEIFAHRLTSHCSRPAARAAEWQSR